MKLRVNLYQPEFHPKLELMSIGAVFSLFGFLILLICGVYAYLSVDGAQKQQALAAVDEQIEMRNALISDLNRQLSQQQEDPQLLAEFSTRQTILEDKERIKAALKDREVLKSASFALLLRELAQQDEQNLWLTHIEVTESSMRLSGEALRPEAVPRWVNRLAQTQYFSGKSFDEAQLNRDEQSLTFNLITSRQEHLSVSGEGHVE